MMLSFHTSNRLSISQPTENSGASHFPVSSLITQRERWRREGECTSVTGISINGGLMNCNVTSSDLRSYIDGKGVGRSTTIEEQDKNITQIR
ncbi:hypothetical protein MANES_08G145600v8 [Manihot esculenta]|uniref:Uncharacterized protein n=1 Tax=Manihot esculenta TaxID=3983 RepID=A0A2C9VGC7_MANES|nr:hypothetical protein MANES_08G145600v8 [Manihot esculenta]